MKHAAASSTTSTTRTVSSRIRTDRSMLEAKKAGIPARPARGKSAAVAAQGVKPLRLVDRVFGNPLPPVQESTKSAKPAGAIKSAVMARIVRPIARLTSEKNKPARAVLIKPRPTMAAKPPFKVSFAVAAPRSTSQKASPSPRAAQAAARPAAKAPFRVPFHVTPPRASSSASSRSSSTEPSVPPKAVAPRKAHFFTPPTARPVRIVKPVFTPAPKAINKKIAAKAVVKREIGIRSPRPAGGAIAVPKARAPIPRGLFTRASDPSISSASSSASSTPSSDGSVDNMLSTMYSPSPCAHPRQVKAKKVEDAVKRAGPRSRAAPSKIKNAIIGPTASATQLAKEKVIEKNKVKDSPRIRKTAVIKAVVVEEKKEAIASSSEAESSLKATLPVVAVEQSDEVVDHAAQVVGEQDNSNNIEGTTGAQAETKVPQTIATNTSLDLLQELQANIASRRVDEDAKDTTTPDIPPIPAAAIGIKALVGSYQKYTKTGDTDTHGLNDELKNVFARRRAAVDVKPSVDQPPPQVVREPLKRLIIPANAVPTPAYATPSGTGPEYVVELITTSFGTRKVRRLVIPPMEEGQLPSRDARIQMEVKALRAQRKVGGGENGLPSPVVEGGLSLAAMGIIEKVKSKREG